MEQKFAVSFSVSLFRQRVFRLLLFLIFLPLSVFLSLFLCSSQSHPLIFPFTLSSRQTPSISSAASNWFDGILITSTFTICMRMWLFRLLFLAFSMIDILKVIEMNRTDFGGWHCILTLNFTHLKFPLYKNRFDWCDCNKLQISRYVSMSLKSLNGFGVAITFHEYCLDRHPFLFACIINHMFNTSMCTVNSILIFQSKLRVVSINYIWDKSCFSYKFYLNVVVVANTFLRFSLFVSLWWRKVLFLW